jgi:glucan phosphoethanolaminetransferase (alkaline phosphatase superfamily)
MSLQLPNFLLLRWAKRRWLWLLAIWLGQGLAIGLYLRSLHLGGLIPTAMHLGVLLALALFCVTPFTLPRVQRLAPVWQRRIFAACAATCHLAVFFYYLVLILAVLAWQSLPSFELIRTYAAQWQTTLSLVGISRTGLVAGLLVLWVLFFLFYFWGSKRLPPSSGETTVQPQPSSRLFWQCTTLLALLLVSYAATQPLWRDREPIHMLWSKHNYSHMIPPRCLVLPTAARMAERSAYFASATAPRPRNLILITVDALRSDQMDAYGGPVQNTPFLSSLVRSGRLHRFDPVYSLCTFSFCGKIGIQSSAYWDQFSARLLTLSDVLYNFGYRSVLIQSGDSIHFYGLTHFFGTHISQYMDGSYMWHGHKNDDHNLIPWLSTVNWTDPRPTYLYLHLMSVHFTGVRDPAFARWQPNKITVASMTSPSEFRTTYRNHYWNGILQADDTIHQIFDLLEREGVLENSLVIITADHGEFLGEHGRYDHGGVPYEAVTRIPLFIYDPAGDRSGQRWPQRDLTSQVDIAPTLLHAIGAPAPPEWSGIPLQLPTDRNSIAVDSFESAGVIAQLPSGRFRYIRNRQSGAELLFNITASSAEDHNLAADPAAQPVLHQMRDLRRQLDATPAP